jgi:hypothetical protein
MTKVVTSSSGKPLSPELEAELRRMAAEELRKANSILASEHERRAWVLAGAADIDSVVGVVLAVAQERSEVLERLRAALLAGREGEALEIARELVNLPKGASDAGTEEVH